MCTSPNRIFYWSDPRAPDKPHTKFTFGEKVHHLELLKSGEVRCIYSDFIRPNEFAITQFYTVGCGHCMECRLKVAKQRSERMIMETITQGLENCWFITLTYSSDNLAHLQRSLVEVDMSGTYIDRYSLSVRDVQLFIKNLRKKLFGSEKGDLRYVAVGEYGEKNERPHYHLIVWNLPLHDLEACEELTKTGQLQWYSSLINDTWKMGRCTVCEVEQGNIAYTARYVQKKQLDDSEYYVSRSLVPPFILQSKGIGKDFLLQNVKRFLENETIYVPFNGVSVELHSDRYFRKLNEKYQFVDDEFFKVRNEKYADLHEAKQSIQLSQTSLSYDDFQKKRNVQLLDRTKSLVRDL